MKKKIRIAQIGVNRYSHATEIFQTIQHLSDDFELVGYALVFCRLSGDDGGGDPFGSHHRCGSRGDR